MKIGIITFHRVINYGGVLQAYALQQTMQRLTNEHEIDIIDYVNNHFSKQYAPISINMFRHPKSLLTKLSLVKYKKNRNRKFSEFVNQYLKLNEAKVSKKNLAEECTKYSKLVTGSDQVWNTQCTGEDFTYFLDVECLAEKYSYAASFAVDRLDAKYTTKIKNCLEQFKLISVREYSGAKIVNELLDTEVVVLPDPTLLLTTSDWVKLEQKMDNIPEKYILIVQMGGEIEELCRHARKIKVDLPIIYINLSQRPVEGIINICEASPREWIYLIHHAEYVVSNSFHGCVFSILFQKEFYFELTLGKNSNSRITTLIEELGLQDRNVTELYKSSVRKSIEYKEVEDKLGEMRLKGYQYLKEVIGEKA